jgi:hypothetical protein
MSKVAIFALYNADRIYPEVLAPKSAGHLDSILERTRQSGQHHPVDMTAQILSSSREWGRVAPAIRKRNPVVGIFCSHFLELDDIFTILSDVD